MTKAKQRSAKRLTAKQRVLRRYPQAHSWDYVDLGWRIFAKLCDAYTNAVGDGETENAAWADAARRLKGTR